MAKDLLSEAKDMWDTLERRVAAAPDIFWTGFRGLTWDLFTKGKSPAQVLADIKAKTEDYEKTAKAAREAKARAAAQRRP